jgi:putative endonuclease
MKHYVYILRCKDKTLYTGYTTDLTKRVLAHNKLKTGARYTKARRPVKLVYFQKYRTKSESLKRENAIKRMPRNEKLKLINGQTQSYVV